MNESQSSSSTGRQCPQCGAELPGDLPPEFCPKCLLKTGLATQPQAGPKGTILVSAAAFPPGLPQPGEELGHYRIVRSLGGGGMGNVFEAEDLENGRRVALKVLSQSLDSPEARQRFFREGRLAASINHPNSVYVFGTEELGGIPLITMELVAGGTLEERVRSRGPMPPAEAVDAVLQIIAGLEVAQRIGIIHRDVKPSNCFVDTDGTVKIGDFGLSISTAVRTETALTAAGSFLGTPAFCSPEQLRGEELNARSDMYSVGATLFYLLTGHTAFQAKNVVALIATVLEQPAPSPRQFQPKIPRGLSNIVRRCLEKQPGERFGNYEELRKALVSYSSTAPVPATLRLRFLAGMVDSAVDALLGVIFLIVAASLWTHTSLTLSTIPSLLDQTERQPLFISLAVWAVWVVYYGLPEGIWGASLGKLVCGLRVVGPDNNPPGFLRALTRALLYVVGTSVVEILVYGPNSATNPSIGLSSTWLENILACSDYILLALLFCTMRRKNGFAAIHDLVTKTRVVSRTVLQARLAASVAEALPAAIGAKPLIGPFHVLDTIEESAGTAWLLGYDLRLLRKVWIRTVPAATPPVPATLRNLGRIGRLRWLAGRRSTGENWDAFEAPNGQSLLQLLQEASQRTKSGGAVPVSNPQPWAQVRYWLCDLAAELSAAQKDGSLPALLVLDRVWITGDGQAKILDFPSPGIPRPALHENLPLLPNSADEARFLGQIAASALEGGPDAATKPPGEVSVPLPLHVRHFLKGFPQIKDVESLLLGLRPLVHRVATVTRRRRAAIVAGCLVFPISIAGFVFLGGAYLRHWTRQNQAVSELGGLLQYRSVMQTMDKTNALVPTDRQFAIYIASHYSAAITNNMAWSNAMFLSILDEDGGRFARESFAQHPAPTDSEIAEANAAMIVSTSRWMFSEDDIKELSALIDRWSRQSDPVSSLLWQSVSKQNQIALTNRKSPASSSNQARIIVVGTLNKLFDGPSIYQPDRFKGIALRPETTWFMRQSPTNSILANLNRLFVNRLLLEDVYPKELSEIQFKPDAGRNFGHLMEPTFSLFALPITLALFVCLPALIAALAFRGGLVLLVTGVTFVRRDGRPASRLRLFWRALVTWSLLLAAPALIWFNGNPAWATVAIGLFCALAIVSIALPQRGLQDRLAGTWPVPR
jgi:serine/threonine protein kinase